jgi:hypothetical protein
MKTSIYLKAGWFALVFVLLFVAGWELYWRQRGFQFSFNDDESLWAFTRKKIYTTSPARPVFIGSSRVKFDIDLAEWQKRSGYEPVQLALVGTSPRPVLTDLGNDPDFKGTLIIGVTEGLFFAGDGTPMEIEARKRLKFYPKWSLSQQASFYINNVLEKSFLFLDENRFSLNSLLKRLPIRSRPGVFVFPNFPLGLGYTLPNRQDFFSDKFLADTSVQHGVQYVWNYLGATVPQKGVSGDTLSGIIHSVKHSLDQIRARGGKVLFLRAPSDGPNLAAEKKTYPREKYWDRLLRETQTEGIYFEDYPELSRYRCLDWSHLTPADARTFTADLMRIIENKTRWNIQKSTVSTKI